MNGSNGVQVVPGLHYIGRQMLAPATPPPKVLKAAAVTARRETLLRLGRALWPVAFAAAVAALSGPALGVLGPVTASLASGLVLVVLGWLTWRGWSRFEPESQTCANRRLEAYHGVAAFAPLTGLGDRPVLGDGDLWNWQASRAFAMLPGLTRPAPWPIRRKDMIGAGALVLVAGLAALSPGQALNAFRFDLSPLVGDGPISVALTATPPDYTGQPAIIAGQAGEAMTVPAGSVVSVRVDGPAGPPVLVLPGRDVRLQRAQDGSWVGRATVSKSGLVSVRRFGSRGRWQLDVKLDVPPRLDGEVTIEAASEGRLQVRFSARDDWGLSSAVLELEPDEAIRSLPQSAIPAVTLTLPRRGQAIGADDGGAAEALALSAEVRRHVLAGLPVKVRLVITDGAGQTATSDPVSLTLPALEPRTALAAAVLDARLEILREARAYATVPDEMATLIDPGSGAPIALDLTDRLTGAPPGIASGVTKLRALQDTGDLLGIDPVGMAGLGLVLGQLQAARSVSDAHGVEADLWALALRFNGSAGTPGQQAIADARDALRDALENGAGPDEIEQRMDDLRAAVSQRLQELAQGQDGDMPVEQPGGDSLDAQDLADMLDRLEDSGTGGDSGSALDQLADLDQLLENLQAGGQGGGGGSQSADGQSGEGQSGGGQGGGGQSAEGSGQDGQGTGEGAGGDPLTRALRQQERLADETLQRQSADGGATGGSAGLGSLADAQRALADEVRRLQPGGPDGGSDGQSDGADAAAAAARDQAARAMDEAAAALSRNDGQSAREAQRQAVQALRNARRLAGRSGQGDDARQARDPLGRLVDGFGDGSDTRVPDQIERRQARDIRDLLRRRQAEPDRSDEERGYLDRLLEGF
jgi:hypothetical protein